MSQGADSSHAVHRKRSTLIGAMNAIVVAALAVLLCVIARNAANANSAATASEQAMENMAQEILKLSLEVDSANRRVLLLEEEKQETKEELERDRELIEKLTRMEEDDRNELRKKEKEIQELMAGEKKKQEEEGENKLRGGATGSVEREMAEMKGKLRDVRQAIQADDRSIVESTFGPGPHRVKIVLEFPPNATEGEGEGNEGNEASADSFTIEMAPLDLMPHSVRVFLQQVDAALWDNCRFYRNAKHIVQAEPVTAGGDITPKKGFVKEKLEHVSFQEYSDDFPHFPYTVGFAGLPGGPRWYINKIDNTKLHGPGGQAKFKYWKTEAEPCFGRIVSGFSVVDRLGRMPINETDPTERMKEYVRIVSATHVQET